MFTRQYRIVTDRYSGYTVQTSFKFLPFWWQIDSEYGHWFSNTSKSIADAKRLMTAHRNPPKYKVKYKE